MTALATAFPASGQLRTETAAVLRAGAWCAVLLFVVLGGWATLATIGGAVIAPGRVIVQGKAQPVQSLDGGMVVAIEAASGQHVEAGAVLARLDPTLIAARRDIALSRLAEALALHARLAAEAAGLDEPRFDPPPLPFSAPDMTAAAASQRALFAARTGRAADARSRLTTTRTQIAAQIAGITAQIEAAEAEAALVAAEAEGQADLVAQGLARKAALADLRRQEAVLAGRLAGLAAERDRLRAAADEAALALRQEEGARTEEVAQGLRDSTAAAAELVQEILGLQAQLDRTVLRAPVAGVVHEMAVTAPGTMLAPGVVLAQVVPVERGVEIEVEVDPRAIDQVRAGQAAEVMIGALDPHGTPRLRASVAAVPPGAVTDPAGNRSFYRVTLHLPETEIARLGGATLTPGMPVEAYLATGERSVLAWLAAPLVRPFSRALREN